MPGENDFAPLPLASATDLPRSGRLLAIDYGHKRLGLAICNDEQSIASPLDNYSRRSDRLDGAYLQQIARDYRCAGCVIGLPLHMGGQASETSHRAQKFAAWLASLTGLPIAYQDERCTSAVVEDQLILMDVSRGKRKQLLDKLAARVILQAYIDNRDQAVRTVAALAENAAAERAAEDASSVSPEAPAASTLEGESG
jgi:putative Holliday junction resolvase